MNKYLDVPQAIYKLTDKKAIDYKQMKNLLKYAVRRLQ